MSGLRPNQMKLLMCIYFSSDKSLQFYDFTEFRQVHIYNVCIFLLLDDNMLNMALILYHCTMLPTLL